MSDQPGEVSMPPALNVNYAVAYGSAGLPVFPVNPASKHPLVSQHHATLEEAQIREWWERWPTALIGHRINPGVVLLDIDPRHGGMTTWQALLAGIGEDVLPARQHHSGRGDGGFHAWYLAGDHPGRLTAKPLHDWARQHGVGQAVPGTSRWTSGIDILHHDWRFTILPPSLHPETHQPYDWDLADQPELMCEELAELVHATVAAVPDAVEYDTDDEGGVVHPSGGLLLSAIEHPDSPADWYTANHTWAAVLVPHGWTLVSGDGDSDGSLWKHPLADSHHEHSASVRHGCLFVYSDNTALEPTEEGDPRGHTRFAAFAALAHAGDMRAAARHARDMRGPVVNYQPPAAEQAEPVPTSSVFLNWQSFIARDPAEQRWLVEGLWPAGRAIALWAAAKAGKSELALWCAAHLALGIHPWSGVAQEPIQVAYFDYEMTEDDLDERLSDFGLDPADLYNLHYALLPPLDGLDTLAGGQQLEQLVMDVGASAVVIDTFGRAVSGEEDKADTVRAFYRHTGSRLKRHGIGTARTDHSGKDVGKGQRGSSAKRDDVDVIWHQSQTKDGNVSLDCRASSRLSWVGPQLIVERLVDPHGAIRYTTPMILGVPAGTKEKMAELDALNVPVDAGRPAVIAALRAAGKAPGRITILSAAIKARRERAANRPGTVPGTANDRSMEADSGAAGTARADDLFDLGE